MSNPLSRILSSIESSTQGVEWAAFFLSGGSDDFAGFRELNVCIDGNSARRGGAKENHWDIPSGTILENIVNDEENRSEILRAIIPSGQALKCVDRGGCEGVLLVITKRRADAETITIPLDWRPNASMDTRWVFDVPAGFRGLLIQYENFEECELSARIR